MAEVSINGTVGAIPASNQTNDVRTVQTLLTKVTPPLAAKVKVTGPVVRLLYRGKPFSLRRLARIGLRCEQAEHCLRNGLDFRRLRGRHKKDFTGQELPAVAVVRQSLQHLHHHCLVGSHVESLLKPLHGTEQARA